MPESVTVTSLAVRLEKISGQMDAHLRECGEANRAQSAILTGIATRLETIERLPMRAVKWIGGIIIGTVTTAAVSIGVQNFLLHQQTVHSADVAAVKASEAADQGHAIAGTIGAPAK